MAVVKSALQNYNVTAIVPVYNVENYVARCLNSLLEQTFPFHEVIVIDDGSTDSSYSICAEFASRNEALRIIQKDNGGLGYARNTGLMNLSPETDYIVFVDSDDWLASDFVEALLSAAVESDVDCVLAGYSKCRDDETVREVIKLEDGLWTGGEVIHHILPRLFGSSPEVSDAIPMSVCCCLFGVDQLKKFPLQFPSEREVISEDFIFKFHYLSQCKRVKTVGYAGYYYRDNPSSLTTSYKANRFEASFGFYDIARKLAMPLSSAKSCVERLNKSMFIYLRSCIAQERRDVSGKGYLDARKMIITMIDDPRLVEIMDCYPIARLGFKQRLFLFLVRKRMVLALQVCAEFNLL